MKPPRLVDAVTLRHFGITEYLGVIEHLLKAHWPPYWTMTVRDEILAGMDQPGCANVLAAGFLGAPHVIQSADLAEVMRLRIALSSGVGNSSDHLGEAEGIFVADKLHGSFVTDDNAAYDLARRRLGNRRVLDTIDLLREAVVSGYFTVGEARLVADAIRNNGRKLRRTHPSTLTSQYFEP